MKKIIFVFLIVFGLSAYNITQASAGCNIVWTGDLRGSMSTNETSRTIQAAQELYNGIQNYKCLTGLNPVGFANNDCYVGSASYPPSRTSYYKWVCTDSTWGLSLEFYCAGDYCYCDAYGTWDVICDDSTTTTTVQQTTTTTTAPATLINLASFTATPKFSKVIIQWSTEAEIDNAGFNIYRAESADGDYAKINASMIPANGTSTEGASYEFIDTDVKNRKTYYYKLEDIDLNGQSTMHGPASATPRLIFGFRE